MLAIVSPTLSPCPLSPTCRVPTENPALLRPAPDTFVSVLRVPSLPVCSGYRNGGIPSAVSRKVIVLTFSLMIVHPLSCRQSWLVEGLAPVAAGSSLPPVGMLPHTSGSVFRISR